jgi:glycogen operon protein
VDDSFVLIFNASPEDTEFRLPSGRFGRRWTCELRTDETPPDAPPIQPSAGDHVTIRSRSLIVLRREN